MCSTSAEKFALNLIEFLVTKEMCQNLTVYGHNGKKALSPNIRKAFRSKYKDYFLCIDSMLI